MGPAAVAEHVAVAFPAVRARRERGPEPLVTVGGVVGHQVDDDPQAVVVTLPDQRLGLLHAAEHRVDIPVVGHVVAAVDLR